MAHKHRCLGCGGVIEGEFDCEYAANHGYRICAECWAKELRYVDDCVMKGRVTLADCCRSNTLMYLAAKRFDDPPIEHRARS